MLFHTRAGDYMGRGNKELPVDYKICSSPAIVFKVTPINPDLPILFRKKNAPDVLQEIMKKKYAAVFKFLLSIYVY